MAFELNQLFVDPDIAEKGVWVDFYGDSKLLLASTESKKYKSTLAKLARAHRIQLDEANEDATQLVQAITAEALAKCVLLDWRDVKMDGTVMPYSWEVGKQAMIQSSKFREFVTERAADTSLFRKEVIEEVKKPSSGS
jgi:hypothetical protein